VPPSTGTHALEICVKEAQQLFHDCVGQIEMPGVNISPELEKSFTAKRKKCDSNLDYNKDGCRKMFGNRQ